MKNSENTLLKYLDTNEIYKSTPIKLYANFSVRSVEFPVTLCEIPVKPVYFSH